MDILGSALHVASFLEIHKMPSHSLERLVYLVIELMLRN